MHADDGSPWGIFTVRCHHLGLLIIGALTTFAALPRSEAQPTSEPRPIDRLPSLLERLPAHAPMAVFAPKLGALVREAQELRSILSQLEPSIPLLTPEATLGYLLWDTRRGDAPTSQPHGLDLNAPATLFVHQTLNAAVIVLPLKSPAQFKLWLDSLPAPSKSTHIVGNIPVFVFGANAAHPLACVVVDHQATCQIGSPAWGDSYILDNYLTFEGRQMRDGVSLQRAWQALTPNPRIAALVRPRQLTQAVIKTWARSVMHTHRLRDTQHRRQVTRSLELMEKRLLRHTRHVNGVAVGIYTAEDRYTMELVGNLTPQGVRRFAKWAPYDIGQLRLRRWLATPALFKAFINAEPLTVAALLRYFDISLPSQVLKGTFGMMTLGVDPSSSEIQNTWIHLFPSALAVGLRGPTSADFVHTHLQRQLQAKSPAFGDASGRPPIVSQGDSERLEIQVLDELLLAATGVMGGYAAKRRLQGNGGDLPTSPQSFLYAAIDLGAINAALVGGLAAKSPRPELRWAESLRRQLFPLFETFRRIELSGAIESHGHRIRISLNVNP